MSRGSTWVGCLTLIAVLVVSQIAVATQTVVLVMAGGSQQELAPVEQHLRSELLAGGFAVTSVQVPELSDSAAFERTASGLVTQAAIAVIRSESAVSGFVWATAKDDERTLVRPIQPVAHSAEASTVFAIRASELLHAVLLELGWPKRSPPETQVAPLDQTEEAAPEADATPEPPPPPSPSPFPTATSGATHEPTAPPASSWGIRAGVVVVGGPGGIAARPAPGVGLTRRLAPGLWLEALLTGPVLGRVEAEAGAARVDQELGVLRFGWRARLTSRLDGFLLGGVGAHRLGVAGRASPPNASRRDAVWSVIALFGAGVRIPVGRAFALAAEADAGSTTPRGQVAFLGQPVAEVAQPLFLGVLTAEYPW